MPFPPRAPNLGSPKYSLSLSVAFSPRVLCQKDRCTLPAEIWATPTKVSFLLDLVITQACYSFSCVGATLLCLPAPILSPSVMGRCSWRWLISLQQDDISFLSLPLAQECANPSLFFDVISLPLMYNKEHMILRGGSRHSQNKQVTLTSIIKSGIKQGRCCLETVATNGTALPTRTGNDLEKNGGEIQEGLIKNQAYQYYQNPVFKVHKPRFVDCSIPGNSAPNCRKEPSIKCYSLYKLSASLQHENYKTNK